MVDCRDLHGAALYLRFLHSGLELYSAAPLIVARRRHQLGRSALLRQTIHGDVGSEGIEPELPRKSRGDDFKRIRSQENPLVQASNYLRAMRKHSDSVTYLYWRFCFRNLTALLFQIPLLTWHSQTTSTDQPLRRNRRFVRLSRILLSINFLRQKVTLLFDWALPYRQLCPCQKQPWTNTIFLAEVKTISGLPGSPLL